MIIVVLIAVVTSSQTEAQRRTREQQALRRSPLEIDQMDGAEFERFLVGVFEALGYQVSTTKATGDFGADLILSKSDGSKTAVQAKCYSRRVSNKAVQEAAAARSHYNCTSAMVVTNNYFTKAARTQAASSRVELWDRDRLLAAIQEARHCAYKPPVSSPSTASMNAAKVIDITCPACKLPIRTSTAAIGMLHCPHCGHKMVQSIQ